MVFLTKEFTADRGRGPEALITVYVPTNHLYLGDIVVFPADKEFFHDLTVEEGVRIFLTGGMSMPSEVRRKRARIPGQGPGWLARLRRGTTREDQ